MTLGDWASLAEIVASIGFIASLVFVGYQIRQNTSQLQRAEHNSTMAQWSTIRQVLIQDRAVAELWRDGLRGDIELDPVDHARLDALLTEYLWAAFHVWERTRRGLLNEGRFEEAVAPLTAGWLSTARGRPWWADQKNGFPSAFVKDVDLAITRYGAPDGGVGARS